MIPLKQYEKEEGRRSKARILVDILKLIKRKGGIVKPTHILYGANLSHVRLNKYLGWLEDNGFVERVVRSGRIYFRVTNKGTNFIIEFRRVEEFSEAFGVEI